MIEFSEIIGHEDIIQHFKRSIEMGKVSQGYIINGEEGSGKKTLTRAIIKTLECEEGGTEPCCKCKSCKQMDTDNQPDVTWVTHDKPNVISVEEIRDQVNKDITIKPYSSRYKIYVIDDAQLLNANAQNALLKTIEEPPEYAIIFLLTSNIDKILPTIISRCIVLNIKPVMGSTPEGTIQQLDMGRGMKKALMKMVEQIGKTVIHPTDKYLMISHCNCLKRAEWLKVEIEKKYAFKGIVIVDTAGVATMYANDGGIIVAY